MSGWLKGLVYGLLASVVVLVAPPEARVPLVGVALGLAAGVYVGFALHGSDIREQRLQWLAAVAFLIIAAGGIAASAWFLAVGWILHAGWDARHHAGRRGEWVPRDYPAFCLSFDLVFAVLAAYLALEMT